MLPQALIVATTVSLGACGDRRGPCDHGVAEQFRSSADTGRGRGRARYRVAPERIPWATARSFVAHRWVRGLAGRYSITPNMIAMPAAIIAWRAIQRKRYDGCFDPAFRKAKNR